METIVYIDGFNLFYRLLAQRPHLKWLNPLELVKDLLPKNKVVGVRYYTARVSGRVDPQSPRRQQLYLDALDTLSPTLQSHYGTFLEQKKWAGLVKPPLNTSQKGARLPFLPWPDVAYVWKTEEKGSDVNLASHLLLNAFQGNYKVAAVLSNDTDLVEPIRIVTQVLGKPVGLLSPVKKPSPGLLNVASFLKHVQPSDLATCQFPDPIIAPGGAEIWKPATWN